MRITLPYQFQAREYQKPLLKALDSGTKRAVAVWNRRSGKDKTCWNFTIKRAFERTGTYYYFLPTYSQAKKVIWDNIDNDGFKMLDHIPKELIKNTNATELKIELVNGSIIQLIASNEFKKSGVGANPIGVVFSEYSVTDPQAWDYVRPILAANGGWAIFNFTPRGMNHGFKMLQQAKDNNWFWQVLTLDDTKVLDDVTIEQEKREMPLDLFEQEYYCKFIEGAGAFFKGVKDCLYDALNERPDPIRKYQSGIDLAKYQDYTVITNIDLMTFNVHKQERFNQIDWPLQEAKIEANYLRYYQPRTTLDSTGIGDPIFDNLANKGLKNINSYKFTENSRRDLLVNLQLLIENRKIHLPDDPILVDELSAFRYELSGEKGKVRIQVPDGLHDDMVMSLALCVWQLPENTLPLPQSIRFLNKVYENNNSEGEYY